MFPTYLTCLCNVDVFSALVTSPGLPEFNPFMILHAEERVELFKPLEAGIEYSSAVSFASFRGTLVMLPTRAK